MQEQIENKPIHLECQLWVKQDTWKMVGFFNNRDEASHHRSEVWPFAEDGANWALRTGLKEISDYKIVAVKAFAY